MMGCDGFGFGRVFGNLLAQLPDFTKERSEALINYMTQQGHMEERRSHSQVNHSCRCSNKLGVGIEIDLR